jgi:hypothetical protein
MKAGSIPHNGHPPQALLAAAFNPGVSTPEAGFCLFGSYSVRIDCDNPFGRSLLEPLE